MIRHISTWEVTFMTDEVFVELYNNLVDQINSELKEVRRSANADAPRCNSCANRILY